MLIKTRQVFDIPQAISLRFALPPVSTGNVIQAGATIVRVEADGYVAARFTDLRPPFQNAIARYVERSLEAGSPPKDS